MTLFLLAAALMLLYGVVYAVFCLKKGGIAAALSVFLFLLLDVGLVALLLYFRMHT